MLFKYSPLARQNSKNFYTYCFLIILIKEVKVGDISFDEPRAVLFVEEARETLREVSQQQQMDTTTTTTTSGEEEQHKQLDTTTTTTTSEEEDARIVLQISTDGEQI